MTLLQRLPIASLLAIGAFTSWVCSDALVKLCGGTLAVDQIIALNKFVVLMVCVASAFYREGAKAFRTEKPGFHIMRGIICCVNMLTVFYALKHLSLANFYTIAFTTPFMIACLSALVLKERPSLGVWMAIVTGFAGVVIAVRPDHYDPQAWPLAAVLSLFAANLCMSLYSLTIKWGGRSESGTALVFYPELVTFAVLSGYALLQDAWPGDFKSIALALTSGIFSGVAALMITVAYRRAMNAHVAPFHYTQIITGSLAGYLIWGDVPTWHVLAGAAVIIASGLYILWQGQDSQTELAEAQLPIIQSD